MVVLCAHGGDVLCNLTTSLWILLNIQILPVSCIIRGPSLYSMEGVFHLTCVLGKV